MQFHCRERLLSLLLMLVAAPLTGCVTEGEFERGMREMVGHPISHYENVAGQPTRKELAPSGNDVYVYKLKNYKDCTVFYEVNTQGIVVNWWHRGVCLAPSF